MRKAAISLSVMALIAGTVCHAQAPASGAPAEEVIVSVSGLYGDWKMVLPEWPGLDKPVTGDFCSFKKRDDGVLIVCADDFLQDVPEVTLDGDKLRMRWGGALNHTIYDAVWDRNGTFAGEIVQAQMGLVAHRTKANMVRLSDEPAPDAPQDSVAPLTAYFPKRQAGFSAEYFGKILEQKDDVRTFPDVFKVSNGNAEQWCLVRAPADVRCRDIP